MKKMLFLFNTVPLPRIKKRMKVARDNFDVLLIYWDRCLPYKPSADSGSIKEIKITVRAPLGRPVRKIIPLLFFSLRCLKEIFRQKPDIIHAANTDMLLIACLYKLFRPAVKVVYEVADLPGFNMLKHLEKALEKYVSLLVLTSGYFYSHYYLHIFPVEKVIVIPNYPYKKVFAGYRKKQPAQELTIGFIGEIRYFRQIAMLIDAAEAVGKTRVFIAGKGRDYDRVASYAGGRDFVHMYGPYDYRSEIAGLYSAVDCLYCVYDADLYNVKYALPNRLYEAIVCGLPLIAASGTKLSEFIESHGIGFSVSHLDCGQLINLLGDLCADRRLLSEKSRNCMRIKGEYFMDNIEKELSDRYKQLI